MGSSATGAGAGSDWAMGSGVMGAPPRRSKLLKPPTEGGDGVESVGANGSKALAPKEKEAGRGEAGG